MEYLLNGLADKKGVYIALVHYPVYNKLKEVVATSITTIDLHDFSRLCRTYDIDRFYIVTPLKAQQELAERVYGHWIHGHGAKSNPTRKEAALRGFVKNDINDVMAEIEEIHQKKPKIVITAARSTRANIGYSDLRNLFGKEDPYIILFGTGWGMEKGLIDRADYALEPIQPNADYNHLPVRAAAAIIIDRVFGDRD